MPSITLTMNSANAQRVVAAIKELYPIPEGDLSTDVEWVKQQTIKFYKRSVRRVESKAARDAVVIVDPDIT